MIKEEWEEFLGAKTRGAAFHYNEGRQCSRCRRPITNGNQGGLCVPCMFVRKCRECGEERPEKFSHSPPIYKGICKKCNRAKRAQWQADYYKKWYAENGRQRDPVAQKAQGRVGKAIKSGLLIRPSKCVLCGDGGYINGHHEDYDNPLDVTWVCSSCHGLIHSQSLVKS